MSPELVRIIECPRDAWQSMPRQIPAAVKADYLRALVSAGFRHIDAVSFVSPAAVPQMADSEQVLALLGDGCDAEIIGIVVNEQGAERAIRTGAVATVGFPYSISATFLERNQRQTLLSARRALEKVHARAMLAGVSVAAYLSMAFGNPYDDPWKPEDVMAACHTLQEMGITAISLADTVGLAGAEQVGSLVHAVLAEFPGIELGVHLHARPEQAAEKVAAAYQAGCRRLDMALGGQGGCPFAQDALVGNVATETALAVLSKLGAHLPRLTSMEELVGMGRSIADRFGAG